jgi:hypothetical protein
MGNGDRFTDKDHKGDDMREIKGWPIGVCSWSLHDNVDTIQSLLEQQGLSHLHLHVAVLEGPEGARLRGFIEREALG